MKTIFRISLLMLCLLSLDSCQSRWPQTVPEAEIIYQSIMWRPYELNFIQGDGSNHQMLEVDENFVRPIWSSDHNLIFGLSTPGGQASYEDLGYPAYWKIKDGSFKRCDDNLPYFGQIEGYKNPSNQNEVILNNVSEIILFNLDTCQQTKMLVDFNNHTGEFKISGISFFQETQALLYGLILQPYESRSYRIRKLDLNTGKQVELQEGINPDWSPDGTQIAYIGLDGLYVMQADGSHSRKLVNTQFFDPWGSGSPEIFAPQPRWSPDGKWLVYHQCIDKFCETKNTPIIKVKVSDGQQETIATGGKYPIWRP